MSPLPQGVTLDAVGFGGAHLDPAWVIYGGRRIGQVYARSSPWGTWGASVLADSGPPVAERDHFRTRTEAARWVCLQARPVVVTVKRDGRSADPRMPWTIDGPARPHGRTGWHAFTGHAEAVTCAHRWAHRAATGRLPESERVSS